MGDLILGALGVSVLAILVVLFTRRPAKNAKAPRPATGKAQPPIDPRETHIHNVAQDVRRLLLHLADEIHRVESATGNSSKTLESLRSRVEKLELDNELRTAQQLFLDEIGSLLQSNARLRGELDQAQTSLDEQRIQIDSLQTAVRVDALTQLFNRSHFEEHLQDAMDRYHRFQEAFCIVIVDVDHFKNINDTYGHPAGDRILKGIATKLKATLRGMDIVARYGGEEFSALLVKADLEAGRTVAEKLREGVEFANFTLGEERIRLTISLGLTQVQPGDTAEAIILRADKALYLAKNNGRNRVCTPENAPDTPKENA